MHINFIPFLALWLVLAVGVIVMIAWRKVVARQEDDALHVMDVGAVSHQVDVAHKLDVIDKWGKILTAIVVVYGLVLGGLYLYQSWVEMSHIGV
jgi:hypothetical protein